MSLKNKKAPKSEKSPSVTPAQRVMAYGGGVGASMVAPVASMALHHSLTKGEVGQATSQEDINRLRTSMKSKARVVLDPDSGIRGAVYRGFGDRGHINAPTTAGPHIAAHEMGHGVFRKGMVGKVSAGLRAAAPLGGIVAPLMALGDPDGTASKASPWVGAATMAPTLLDEGVASYKAIKGMRAAGYSPASISLGKRQLAKAFGTYGLGAAGAVGVPMVTRHLMKKFKARNMAKEKVGMNVIVMRAFADELAKIANVGGDLTKTVLRKATPGLTAIPKVRPHVNPETVFGGRKAVGTVAGRGAALNPAHSAPVGGGTQAGVAPKSIQPAANSQSAKIKKTLKRNPGDAQAGRDQRVQRKLQAAQKRPDMQRPTAQPSSIQPAAPQARQAPQQAARPVGQPSQGSNLNRNLAIGGGIAAAGGMAGYMMPHRQQQPQAR